MLRTTLSAYLGRSRGVLTDPARIVICAGFSQAVTVLSRALRDVGISELAFRARSRASDMPVP